MKKLNEKIKAYYTGNWRTIDFIPAWNYLQFDSTDDIRFLLKGLDYENMPELFEVQRLRLEIVGDSLRFAAAQFELENNRRNQIVFDLKKRISLMEAEYDEVLNICNYMKVAGYDPEFDATLQLYKYQIFPERDLKAQLTRIEASNENRKIKINEQLAEYAAMTKQSGKEPNSLESVQIMIERNNKLEIDLKKITMKKWLTLKQQYIKEIETANNKKAK